MKIRRQAYSLLAVVVVVAILAGGVGAQVYGTYFDSLIVGKQLYVDPTATVTMPGGTMGASSVVFEGATTDAYETTLAITDPTADRTITFPNSTGTVALNPYGASIEFEGTTADDYETTVAVTDPTADRTITLPNVTGTVMVNDGTGALVAGTATLTKQSPVTVTDGSTIAATTSYVPITAAGAVGTSAITGCTTSGRMLVLANVGSNTITITDTGTLKLAGNAALTADDTLTLIGDGTNCVEMARSAN